MKVAITGASGFIGQHVLSEIKYKQVDLTVMLQNKAQESEIDPNTRNVVIDISSPPSDTYNILGRPDVLIHLAWGGLPNYHSLHHIETELPNQYRFLANLVRSGLSSLVVTGTCFEYGMQSGCLSETQVTNPQNPYGYAKDALRRQLEFLRKFHSYTFTWARIFYIYGNGQSNSSLLSQLKQAVERGDARFNMSGGEQIRDYLPVNELAHYIVELGLQQADIGVVNLCSGFPISVRSLVESWIDKNNWDIKLNLGFYPYPDYEPFAFWGNRNKLDSYFEDVTMPTVDVEHG